MNNKLLIALSIVASITGVEAGGGEDGRWLSVEAASAKQFTMLAASASNGAIIGATAVTAYQLQSGQAYLQDIARAAAVGSGVAVVIEFLKSLVKPF